MTEHQALSNVQTVMVTFDTSYQKRLKDFEFARSITTQYSVVWASTKRIPVHIRVHNHKYRLDRIAGGEGVVDAHDHICSLLQANPDNPVEAEILVEDSQPGYVAMQIAHDVKAHYQNDQETGQ